MRLSALIQTVDKLDTLKFQLPSSEFVPAHFHITEVGEITRKYIDCGGIQRQENKINLQLWVAADIEHRLRPSSLLDILEMAQKQLGYSNLEVEIEYQQGTIGRYKLAFDGEVFQLINTNTACLAPDQCGIPKEKSRLGIASGSLSCNPESGCC